MSEKKKVSIVIKKKIYLPLKEGSFPIMMVTPSVLSTLLSKIPEQNYMDILPTSGIQITPNSPMDGYYITLRGAFSSTTDVLKKLVIVSKMYDMKKDVETATIFLEAISEYEKDNDISKLTNGNMLTEIKRNVELFIQKNENAKIKETERYEGFLKEIEKYNDPVIYLQKQQADRVSLSNWILPNRKNFPQFINQKFNSETIAHKRLDFKLWDERNEMFQSIQPFPQQKFVSDFVSENTPYRGLLLYHGLGSGKSGASILIAEGFRDRHIVIMLPASLHNNYIDEIRVFGEVSYRKNFHWVWITLSMGSVELDTKIYSFLESKGIPRDLARTLIREKTIGNEKVKGLYMIDYTQSSPNYHLLTEEVRKEISEQVSKMFDYKYSILHYNAGAYTLTELFKRLIPNFSEITRDLFGDKKISRWNNQDRNKLLNYIYDPKNKIKNPLDDKVLIIDEIHNLTSKMIGEGFNGPRLYELIMRAKNLKLVLLSGTPVINYPFELAIMFNMLRGNIYSYKIPLKKVNGSFRTDELTSMLSSFNLVDRYIIHSKLSEIEVTRTPYGFVNNYDEKGTYIGVIKSEENSISDEDFLDILFSQLAKQNYQLNGTVHQNTYSMFPDLLQHTDDKKSQIQLNSHIMLGSAAHINNEEKNFTSTYINETNFTIKNPNLFKNRIVGLVSFFNEISGIDEQTGANLFPDKIVATTDETEVEMSNYQFIEYAIMRRIERELEKANEKRRHFDQKKEMENAVDKTPNLFRVFSRQRGIFVFPPGIARPTPVKKSDDDNAVVQQNDPVRNKIKQILSMEEKVTKYEKLEKYLNTLDEDKYDYAMSIVRSVVSDDFDTIEDLKDKLESYEFEECDFLDECSVSKEDDLSYRELCEKAISALTKEHLTVNDSSINLSVLSPKYVKILDNINNTPGLVFCYSQFRSVEGIEMFARVMNFNGYSQLRATIIGKDRVKLEFETDITPGKRVRYEITPNQWRTLLVESVNSNGVKLNGIDDVVPIDKVHLCYYALWTGTETPEQRSAIQREYNKMENMYGQKCLILLITQSGAEGISLKNVRQVHIMEPYWNNVRVNQVIGRARRIKSHVNLPEEQRNVKVFNYIIKYTNAQKNGTWINEFTTNEYVLFKKGEKSDDETINKSKENIIDEYKDKNTLEAEKKNYANELSNEVYLDDGGLTSDDVLKEISLRKEHILNSFLNLVKEVAVDCNYNRADNIASDPSLKDMKCYDIINTNNNFTYELIPQSDVSTLSEPTSSIKIVQEKRATFPYKFKDYGVIKLITKIPMEYPDGVQGLKMLEDGHVIYDYYLYHGLYYKDNRLYRNYYKAGVLKKIGQAVTFDFDEKFIEKLDDYKQIEECMKTIGEIQPNANELERVEYSKKVKECHRRIQSQQQTWKCLVCNNAYSMDTEKCEGCDFSREISVQFETASRTTNVTKDTTSLSSNVTVPSNQTKATNASDTSSMKKRRVIKNIINK
jgi:hypothetical protein